MRQPFLIPSLGVIAALFAADAGAQVATALVREGDALPAAGAGHNITGIENSAVNGVGGWSARITTTDGVTTLSHVFGNPAGGIGALIFSEQMVGVYQQTAFESFFGMDNNGSVSYSPTCTDTVLGLTGLDCVFQDLTPLAVEGQPIGALPGKEFRFASRPGITANGVPYWVSGIDDIATGSGEGNGLFYTNAALLLLKTGDVIPPLAPLDGSAVDFDVRMSAGASHHILVADTTAATSADAFLLIDGQPVTGPNGTLIGEGQPVGALSGGLAGENWANFDFLGINENGDWMMTGDTSAATTVDEFVVWNGRIVYREGMVLDGQTIVGSIGAAYMNEAGDLAINWEVTTPAGNREAIFLNGKFLIKEGDAVDLNGDGLIDPGAILADITGISSITVGADRKVYFNGNIDVNGTTTTTDDIEGLFVLDDPCGTVARIGVGCAGSGGFVPNLNMSGCPTPGGTVNFSIDNCLGGTTAILVFGVNEQYTPIGFGCTLNIGSLFPVVVPLPLGGAGPGQGSIAFPATLPGTIAPVTFGMQALVIDAASFTGGVASNGLRVTID
jgi:hypothetical protein